MDKNTVLIATITLLTGFIAGFLVANSVNRAEVNAIRSTVAAAAAPTTGSSQAQGSDSTLSPDEIKSKISEADKNPTNFSFQKNLGIALYRYGAMTQDEGVIAESARILARAKSIDPKDLDVLVALGNAYFDLGFAKKDPQGFDKARAEYSSALAIRDDADVRTDLGISYFVQDTPDLARSASELEKVIASNPRQDRAIQFLAQVYIKQNRLADADKMIARLKDASPGDPAIDDLSKQLTQARTGK